MLFENVKLSTFPKVRRRFRKCLMSSPIREKERERGKKNEGNRLGNVDGKCYLIKLLYAIEIKRRHALTNHQLTICSF